MSLTLGSLFDGSGGFPLGGVMAGIKPLWASEIEPFPIRVTTKRFPNMKHYGDVSAINGFSISPVDIITFGSPCQDLSIAGKREGIKGARSGLFYQAVRIIKEMREATNGKYPRYIVWENVPGAFSSNKGEDFGCVLDEICSIGSTEDIHIARPKKWNHAESEGMSGYSESGFKAWKEASRYPEIRIGESDSSMCVNDDVQSDMKLFDNHRADCRYRGPLPHAPSVCAYYGTGGVNTPLVAEPYTMRIRCGKPGGGKGALIQKGISGTLGCNNDQTLFQPKAFGICADQSHSMLSENPESGFYEADSSRTIDTSGMNPSCNQGGIAVVDMGGGKSSCNVTEDLSLGSGVNEDVSFTLNATDRHAVAYNEDELPCYSASKGDYQANLLAALKDVYEVFRADSTMKPSMKSAINVIENTFTDKNAYPEELGLGIIEKDFPSQKIRDCHKTLLESQHSGGNPDNVIEILLQDRAIWEKSNALLQKKCQKMKLLVNTACVVTTLLCVVFIRVLMGANMDIDISHNILVMICTAVMYALDLIVIWKSDGKMLFDMNGDGRLGNEDNEKYDKRMVTYYNDIMEYDEQEMWKKSAFRAILPLAIGIGLFIMGFKIAGTVAVGIAALVFFNHRIDYNLKMKALVSEIKIAFPRWLMQIELFIQSNNVYNSLYLSYNEAPEIIKPELGKMLKALDQSPESKQPFLDFFSAFRLTDISSSMLMLYSIQKDVGSAEEQISNILKKNLAVYEESLDERSDSRMGSMYVLFMIPELTSSGKLLVDMVVFFMVAMTSMSNY